eukprot:SAG31_NODE_46389_length_254_cov_1.619355_1_plen_21_part_10
MTVGMQHVQQIAPDTVTDINW